MAARYTLASASTSASKVLTVTDSTTKTIYSFPSGTGLVGQQPGTVATNYYFKLQHPMVGDLTMAIADINTIGGSAPAGNNYATDMASIIAILP